MTAPRFAALLRSDHRGLGYQTRDYYRHLKPAKALHVRMASALGRWTPYAEHDDWYPGVPMSDWDGRSGRLETEKARALLEGIDVLLSAETVYDDRTWGWAREAGVRTVVVGNPEFLRPETMASADLIVLPSTWQASAFPGTIHLPHPVDRAEFPFTPRPLYPGRPLRFLHLVGHRAHRDRAGTDIVLDCLRFLRHPIDLTVRCQGPLSAPQQLLLRGLRRYQIPTVISADIDDPRALYADYDVLLAPRRYGGLSLPLNEAASSGLGIIAVDRDPERSMLPAEALIPAHGDREFQFQGGLFGLDDGSSAELAAAIDRLTDDPGIVARLSQASDAYARSVSWDVLRPRWEALLERACNVAVTA